MEDKTMYKLKKLLWYLKQLLPLTYWSIYQEFDKNSDRYKTYFSIYRMWFGQVFNAVTVEVNDYWNGGRKQT
jgi:hypothetical protein